MIVDARQGGLSISETADLVGCSCTTVSLSLKRMVGKNLKTPREKQFCGQKCLVNERGQRRARPAKADRKVTVTQIITHYNSGMQKSISELTTRPNIFVDRLQKQNKAE